MYKVKIVRKIYWYQHFIINVVTGTKRFKTNLTTSYYKLYYTNFKI